MKYDFISKNLSIHIDTDTLLKQMQEGYEEGIEDALEAILEESNREVPVDTGSLLSTGTVVMGEDGKSGVVEYGDDVDVDYAVYVHELQKPYLSISVNRLVGELDKIIGKGISKKVD